MDAGVSVADSPLEPPPLTLLPRLVVRLDELAARFPVMHPLPDGSLEGDCNLHDTGSFIARQTDSGWEIGPCSDGCSPAVLMGAREPGADDAPAVPDKEDPRVIFLTGLQTDGTYKEPPPKKRAWGIQVATDFLAREFPPLRWLYLDMVPADSLTVLMSAPNAGKTFMALEIACQVAANAARQGLRVVMVEEEGSGAALQTRLRRAIEATGASPERIGIAWNTGRSLLGRDERTKLAAEVGDCDLLILDSLSALCNGVDENDSRMMGLVANSLHELKTIARCAILALHHMTKEAWKEGERPTLRHMRGHSALPGRCDAALALVPLESNRDCVRFELHVLKQRDGNEKAKPKAVTVSMVGGSADVTMIELEENKTEEDEAKLTTAMTLMLTLFPDTGTPGISKNNACRSAGGNRQLNLRACAHLEVTGAIIRGPGKLYTRR